MNLSHVDDTVVWLWEHLSCGGEFWAQDLTTAVFFCKTLNSYSAPFHPGVFNGYWWSDRDPWTEGVPLVSLPYGKQDEVQHHVPYFFS